MNAAKKETSLNALVWGTAFLFIMAGVVIYAVVTGGCP